MTAFYNHYRTSICLVLLTALIYALMWAIAAVMDFPPSEGLKPHRGTALSAEELKQKEKIFQENLQKQPALLQLFSTGLFVLLVTGFFFNLYFIVKSARGGFVWPRTLEHGPVTWELPQIVMAGSLLFFCEALIYFAMAAAGGFSHERLKSNETILVMANSLLRNIAVSLFIVWMVCKKMGHGVETIGLTAKRFLTNVRLGIEGYFFIVPTLVTVLLAVLLAVKIFAYEPAPQPVVEMYLKKDSEELLIYLSFFVAVLGPIFEEIFFRGFMYKGMRGRWGTLPAMWISAAVFAVLHMNVAAFFPILVLGYFLAFLYEKSGSLVPSIVLHMTHNLVMVGLTLWFRSLTV